MKRKILFVCLVIALAATASAQERERGERQGRTRRPSAEAVTVSGSMIVAHGMPALRSGDDTYLVIGISRLAGFIDGLREGAQVSIEGRAMTSQRDGTLKYLVPSKLTLGGRTYDLAPPEGTFGPGGLWAPPQSPRQPRAPQIRHPRNSM